jgi:hypothetical protein
MSDPYVPPPPQQPPAPPAPPAYPTPPVPPDPPAPQPQHGQPQYGQPQYEPQAPPPYAAPQPQYAPPPQYAPQPQYAPPGPTGPPPKGKSNKGCLVALIVVLVLFVGGGIATVVAISVVGHKAFNDAVGSVGPCPYVSDADATAALNTDAEATLFDGGLGKFLDITDDRVLADQRSCILQQKASTDSGSGMPGLGRAVKYSGSDAESRYQQELTKAKGITEDRGNGLSVSTDSYFNKDVSGLGDEAFCTKSSGLTAGVLVRQGSTLVYVSLAQAGTTPGIDLSDPNNPKLGTDDSACEAAQVLARKILG